VREGKIAADDGGSDDILITVISQVNVMQLIAGSHLTCNEKRFRFASDGSARLSWSAEPRGVDCAPPVRVSQRKQTFSTNDTLP
jgi:hypothetical protein